MSQYEYEDLGSKLTDEEYDAQHLKNIEHIKSWEQEQLSKLPKKDRKKAVKYMKLKKKMYKLERKIDKLQKYSLI